MKQAFLFIPLFFLFSSLNAQVSEAFIQAKIDSGFDYAEYGVNIPEAIRIANELLEIGEDQQSYLASVKACFILGEVHYNLPSKDSAIYWFEKARSFALNNGNEVDEGKAYRSKATVYFDLGLYNIALANYDSSLVIWHELNDTSNIIYTLINRAWLNNQAEMTSESMKDYLDCLSYAIASKDSLSEAQVYNGLSILHKKQKNYELADEYSWKSIKLSELINDEFGVVIGKGNLAISFKDQGLYEEAYAIYLENVQSYKRLNYQYGEISCYCNMVVCSNQMGDYYKAIDDGLKAIELCKIYGATEAETDVTIEMAKSYLALNNPEKALGYSLKSLTMANRLVSLEKRRDAHLVLSDSYADLEDHKLALQHFKSYKLVSDSIINTEKANIVLDLQEKYETAEKEKEITQLKSEAEISEVKRIAMIGVFFIVVISSILIINREIRRRKKAKALHLTQLKLNEVEKQRLEDELAFKKRELTAVALQIAQKNEMIQEIKEDIQSSSSGDEIDLNSLYRKLNLDKQIDKSWEIFIDVFKETKKSFFKDLTQSYPNLSKNEIRLCALMNMNISSKEIAAILNISDDGIKKARYRLRKKMNLESNDSLEQVVLSFS